MKQDVTLKDVAKKAGVSINTVSRALNGTNREVWPCIAKRADEIRRIANDMGYRPNAAARAMRTAKLKHVAVVMGGAYAAPWEYPVIMGINERLHDAGYALSVVSAVETGSRDATDAVVLKERFLAGALVMHVPAALREHVTSSLEHCVHVDSNIRTKDGCIYRDERHAGAVCANELIDLGYKRIMYLGHEPWDDCHIHVQDRLEGVRDAARKRRAEFVEILLAFRPADLREAAKEAIGAVTPSTAVVAVGQDIAEWFSHAMAHEGLCPGRDVALASVSEGFNCRSIWPGLSRVGFDRVGLGRQAADMMLSLLEGKKKRVKSVAIRGEWIAGDTALARVRVKGKKR